MITFRLTPQSFTKNSFIALKDTPIGQTLNRFGYIHHFVKNVAIIWWYEDFIKQEDEVCPLHDLIKFYKSIYPYFNTKFIRGNIWKFSYLTLLERLDPNKGFTNIQVDKITYKKTPKIHDKVIISDAVYVLSNNITNLEGKIKRYYKRTKEYRISTQEQDHILKRTSFTLLPQDEFYLLNIRCVNLP